MKEMTRETELGACTAMGFLPVVLRAHRRSDQWWRGFFYCLYGACSASVGSAAAREIFRQISGDRTMKARLEEAEGPSAPGAIH